MTPRHANEIVDTTTDVAIHAAVDRRRAATAAAWDITDETVLIGAGELVPMPGRLDMTYPFRVHPEYFYLTDASGPGGVLAYTADEGWIHFAPAVTAADRLWSGAADPPPGPTTDDLSRWIGDRAGRPVIWLGTPPPERPNTEQAARAVQTEQAEQLSLALARVRRPKDAVELARMRAAAAATVPAFAAAHAAIAEGRSEREIQIELETAAFRAGAAAMAYDTIVGSGPNSAVLHFPPSARRMGAGELVLIDAGAEHAGYASDITRTYVVGGQLASGLRADLHALVRRAELAAIERCIPGVEWRDVHRTAALVIAEGLAGIGLLRGAPDDLVDTGATALFSPHGVGHFVGLGVRDAGGVLADRRGDAPPYPNLRIDLPLEPGMVVTVEPGIYFVPALLQDPERRHRHRDAVNWDRVDGLLEFGGIRIEDNVVITADGHEVITTDVPVL